MKTEVWIRTDHETAFVATSIRNDESVEFLAEDQNFATLPRAGEEIVVPMRKLLERPRWFRKHQNMNVVAKVQRIVHRPGRRPSVTITALMVGALAACTTNSTVQTGETWAPPTEAQVAAFQASLPQTINPYIQERRSPQMGRDGCASSVREDKRTRKLVIPAFHPDETYCFRAAPFANTTLALPPGARLQDATSAMGQYLEFSSASTNEGDVLLITSKCVPVRKDEAGNVLPVDLHEFVGQDAIPYCPRPTADLTVVMSTGIAQFKVYLNNETHTARIEMGDEAPMEAREVRIPMRPSYAQDLHVESIDGQMIPWTPDAAWSDGSQTVIVWHRPMPTLPAFMIGPDGEQRAQPQVVNHQGSIAMVYPQRVTEFQLRLDDRILAFSEVAPVPSRIQPAESSPYEPSES